MFQELKKYSNDQTEPNKCKIMFQELKKYSNDQTELVYAM